MPPLPPLPLGAPPDDEVPPLLGPLLPPVPMLPEPPVVAALPPVVVGVPEPPVALLPPTLVEPPLAPGPGADPPAFDEPPAGGVELPLLCEQLTAANRHSSPDVAEIELNLIEDLRSIATGSGTRFLTA